MKFHWIPAWEKRFVRKLTMLLSKLKGNFVFACRQNPFWARQHRKGERITEFFPLRFLFSRITSSLCKSCRWRNYPAFPPFKYISSRPTIQLYIFCFLSLCFFHLPFLLFPSCPFALFCLVTSLIINVCRANGNVPLDCVLDLYRGFWNSASQALTKTLQCLRSLHFHAFQNLIHQKQYFFHFEY